MVAPVENIVPASPLASHSPPRRVGGKMTAHPAEVREIVHALYVAGVPPLRIARQTGVPHNTVRKWAQRHKWTLGRDALDRHTDGAVEATIAEKISRRSEHTRDRLSAELVNQADILAEHPAKSVAEIAGGRGVNGRATTLSTIVSAADKLYGWSKHNEPNTLVQINYVADLRPAEPATEPAGIG